MTTVVVALVGIGIARLSKLQAVPVTNAVVGIDPADRKQNVVTDHDSKVQARRTFRCKAWTSAPPWRAGGRATRAGFSPG